MDEIINPSSPTSHQGTPPSVPVVVPPRLPPEVEIRALDLAEQLFPGPASIAESFDPETPDRCWHVLTVAAQGDLADIMARKRLWHRRMFEALGPSGVSQITICVIPEEA